MTHPHHLHAQTALWALRASWTALHHQAATAALEPADGLHGQTYGSRHPIGGHSDGAATALLTATADRDRWARLDDQVRDHVTQACWLIRSATGMPRAGRTLLDYVAAGLPLADPGTARDVTGWLQVADRTARRALHLADDRIPLPGVACPGCYTRSLEIATAGPRHAWTVACAAGCRCHGRLCPCTSVPNTEPPEGVPHIWPWTAVVTDVVTGAGSQVGALTSRSA